ncbi:MULTISPECIES: MFS transporter [unclassified Pseudonocardia]|uniref:MFS transporter n=1 Tax=unclassified Pseudonocardia TaxID=2619320 RepID=UPI0001FFE7AB|nr:MFS transporter [Pseudonocardia sp. Ae707_Ps1]OLM09249.1 4-hydroxybenzoate transporter [Pseudonocardia sp. Ae707_Ps1]
MSSPPIDITKVVDTARFSRFQKRTIVVCWLLLFCDGFNGLSIGYAIPSLSEQYGVSAATFSVVVIAALLGEILAAMFIAPLADRFGRRRLVRLGVLLFSLTAVPAYFASSIEILTVCRFVAGVGIGIAVPNGLALGAEYTPTRAKGRAVSLLLVATSSGGMIAGLIAASLIPAYGGSALLLAAGAIPLVLLIATWPLLPESVQFLAAQKDTARVRPLLKRIDPTTEFPDDAVYVGPKEIQGARLRALFQDGRGPRTLLIWFMMFWGLFNAYFLFNWVTTLLTSAGVASSTALIATSMATLGGSVGGVLFGVLMDRTRFGLGSTAIGPAIGVTSLLLLAFNLDASAGGIIALCVGVGFGGLGATLVVQVLPAMAYPTAIRATGVGWAVGVSRIGGLFAPALGGAMIASGVAPRTMLLISIVPVAVVGLCVIAYRVAFGSADHAAAENSPDAASTARDSRAPLGT